MSARVKVWIGITVGLCAVAGAVTPEFQEGWEVAETGTYVPGRSPYIQGDEGVWFIGDAISVSPRCGITTQKAQILLFEGSQALKLISNDSGSECSDLIWASLMERDFLNVGFGVRVVTGTTIAFDEVGMLTCPGPHGKEVCPPTEDKDGECPPGECCEGSPPQGKGCPLPPCFDNVSLLLTDNHGNTLAYVLQRYPEAVANVPNPNFVNTYREVFLDPDMGHYVRDLFEDFQRIPLFNPQDAKVISIEFRVDEHGWAILDNLVIAPTSGPDATAPVWRFWSQETGCHLLTTSNTEKRELLSAPDCWTFEGVAFFALSNKIGPETLPVYRFFSRGLCSHFYTIDEVQKQRLITSFPDEWTFEGIAFYAWPPGFQPPSTRPVYHFRSTGGCHFYTIDEAEKDKLRNKYRKVWKFEGIVWYAYPP
jgi:hypothetical protein